MGRHPGIVPRGSPIASDHAHRGSEFPSLEPQPAQQRTHPGNPRLPRHGSLLRRRRAPAGHRRRPRARWRIYVGYDIGFPPDHLFRGVHRSVGIDRSGRAPVVRQQDEIYVRHTFQRAGIPCPLDDLCYFFAPQTIHTGTAILQFASYGGLWADSQFDEAGTVFNYDITYDPTSTSVAGERRKPETASPFGHVSDRPDESRRRQGTVPAGRSTSAPANAATTTQP